MNNKIFVCKENNFSAQINQISVKRDWMDQTSEKHAYQCMPISLANTLGWAISFPEDISFIWDGISNSSDSHVKVIKGNRFCSTARANATISFNTFLKFKTDQNITTLIMPVPNYFNENAQCFTTLISTSFYDSMLPIAWKILKPNIEINITAGTPIAVIIPISLTNLQEFEVIISNKITSEYNKNEINKKLEFIKNKMEQGKFSQLYRKAINYNNESVGNHEVYALKLKTTEE